MDIIKFLTRAVLSPPAKSTSAVQARPDPARRPLYSCTGTADVRQKGARKKKKSAFGFHTKPYPDIAEKHNLTIWTPDSARHSSKKMEVLTWI